MPEGAKECRLEFGVVSLQHPCYSIGSDPMLQQWPGHRSTKEDRVRFYARCSIEFSREVASGSPSRMRCTERFEPVPCKPERLW
jgi:hypothetical protein